MRYIWLILFLLVAGHAAASSLTVYDAGEGLLARIKTDNSSIWIDTGSLIKIRQNISRLQPPGEPSPTDLILTHLHPDHASGIFELVERYPEINVYDSCMPGIGVEDGDLIRWTDEFLSSLKKRTCLDHQSRLAFDDVEIEVLWPTGEFQSKDHNYYSLVLKVSARDIHVLMMGDANKNTEKWLLSHKSEILKGVDVLIVGHHGSGAVSSSEFLSAVYPRVAVVPVNLNNARGYPSQETLDRIIQHGAELWVTGIDGDYRINFD
ncbi:MBL fold metallo-hydrolase [Alphaproteobacteria bacterium]|nr:MBL fold metallo-hydrolase [Alphaproteobacteria bacterium]